MIKSSRGCCEKEELDQVKEAFEYGYFGLAYKVNEFEEQLKKYLNTDREVVAVNSGTNALHIALASIGVKSGDEVILPSFTFVATAQAISGCGATPVFCEVDYKTMLMDVKDVENKISSKTKAIIPVHYAGVPCDMDGLMNLKEKYGIRIIEDAAHAIGSIYKGKKIGSFGDITCFSFDSIKVMTCGEGGAVVLSSKEDTETLRKKRLLGIDRKTMHTTDWKKRSWIYDVPCQGYRYHMSNINAAIGLAQIKKLDSFIEKRRRIAKIYMKELVSIDQIELPICNFDEIAPFMFVIRVKNNKREDLKRYLMDYDIESGISYIPCHHFSYYKDSQYLPNTDQIFNEILCIPMHYALSDDDVLLVSDCIKNFYHQYS